MPVSIAAPIRRLSQVEFGEVSYEVMRHVFSIHNELGRFFDEGVYKRELAQRFPGVRLELPIDVCYDSFRARYFIDVLVGDGGIFEFKAVESLVPRHKAQLLNYVLLCNAAHGKLVSIRPEVVEHEFVNTLWDHAARIRFEINSSRWNGILPAAEQFRDGIIATLRDVGTGLEIALYEAAVTHFFGGAGLVEADIAVALDGRALGFQRMRLINPGVAFKITGFDGSLAPFEIHARRLLEHTDLQAIAWVNINLKEVTFIMLER